MNFTSFLNIEILPAVEISLQERRPSASLSSSIMTAEDLVTQEAGKVN